MSSVHLLTRAKTMKVWILRTGQNNKCTWCLNSEFGTTIVFSDETAGRNALKAAEHVRLNGKRWFTHEGERILVGDWEKLTEHTTYLK